ncbi:MAG: Cys-Gln thioester bond-forming surface protein [Paracoccaceae bacterium]
MLNSIKTSILTATLVTGVIAGSAASAATIKVGYQGRTVFGAPNHSQNVKIVAPPTTAIANAGAFRLNGSNGFGAFVAFCVDLSKHIRSGKTYTTASASAYGGTVDNAIDRLFTSAYSGVNSAIKGAAFQVALWEIITDTGAGYNLSQGQFQAQSSVAVRNQANLYLAGLSGAATGGYKMTYLNSGVSQNLVTVSAVPVPAAAGMLGLGLLGLFGLRRRKTA